MKTLHIAEMIAEDGRDGKVEAPDGNFSVRLSADEHADSLTPEHLFAGAYGACFSGALRAALETAHLDIEGVSVLARAHLEEDDRGGCQLNVELRATLPGVNAIQAKHLLHQAHQTCPYSKATRGNIKVTLALD